MADIDCPICGQRMPAGRGSSCWLCSWQMSFERRLKTRLGQVANDELGSEISAFANWFRQRRGAHFAALNMHRYYPFIEDIFSRWAILPPYEELVDYYGAEALRRVRSVVLWLDESGQIKIDPVARERSSDRHRVAAYLVHFPQGVAREAMQAYHRELQGRQQGKRLKMRSIRLALGVAEKLLRAADVNGRALPTQKVLRKQLLAWPGQHASLCGFVTFLNWHYSLGLNVRVSKTWLATVSRNRLEDRLLALYKQAGSGERFERRWISTALAFFHGVSRVPAKSFDYLAENHRAEPGFKVTYLGKYYWVPRLR